MLKLTRFFSSRNELVGNFQPKKINNVKDALLFGHSPLQLRYSTGGAGWLSTGKTYADYSIFKGKAALSMIPILPRFSKLDSGSSKVDKKGVVLLSFMPAIGTRKYDYAKRQAFALSATEIGSLISLGPGESCEFMHDPSMKSSLEGQVKKTLVISPMGNDGGYFFSLNVMNIAHKTNDRLSVPVTKAEFTVMRAACGFALPHIMGWDQATRPRSELSGTFTSRRPDVRVDPDLEWGR